MVLGVTTYKGCLLQTHIPYFELTTYIHVVGTRGKQSDLIRQLETHVPLLSGIKCQEEGNNGDKGKGVKLNAD